MAPTTQAMRPERPERPYNTRRKSLSLHSLGIHVPVTQAARAAAARDRASSSSSSNHSSSTQSSMASSTTREAPSRRLKRAHTQDDDDVHSEEPLSKRRGSASVKFDDTPPPSPAATRQSIEMDEESRPIDMDAVNDEIVEAVIVQLQNTGNRPHLVKELAAVLMQQLKIVQQSANPCAIISSRLATYLKRSGWSAETPCPLAKELESVHPRRTYFYLTTCPHQPLPDPAQAATLSHLAHNRTIISPSISSGASNSEDADSDAIRRRELSPSPEVDLSSPEFDDMDDEMPSTPIGSYSLPGFCLPPTSHFIAHHLNGRSSSRRAASPPLEKDEKEFTQTATGLQKRKLNGDLLKANPPAPVEQPALVDLEKEEGSLFGGNNTATSSSNNNSGINLSFVSSPAIRSTMYFPITRKDAETESWNKWDSMLEWDRSPENIELDELDGLLSDY
ncbi:hypothetical protein QBC40DRAFT_90633 [Triangularia verruculosa]|uniref:GDS1 winged helix domain-containing protein n=1 Tax=Triangularia verruculosa TaxID=2587418 RepID=A0AAN7ARM0_9PEZI|nr:hypothetical protein QBC40DRAFT_90633 [Triangularia verruculosa]